MKLKVPTWSYDLNLMVVYAFSLDLCDFSKIFIDWYMRTHVG